MLFPHCTVLVVTKKLNKATVRRFYFLLPQIGIQINTHKDPQPQQTRHFQITPHSVIMGKCPVQELSKTDVHTSHITLSLTKPCTGTSQNAFPNIPFFLISLSSTTNSFNHPQAHAVEARPNEPHPPLHEHTHLLQRNSSAGGPCCRASCSDTCMRAAMSSTEMPFWTPPPTTSLHPSLEAYTD